MAAYNVTEEEEEKVSVYLSHIARKPVFEVAGQFCHKPGCTATEDGEKLEIFDLGSKGIVLFLKQKQRC